MVKMYYDGDADLELLKDKTITIVGYGSQGHAHALNLRDSGLEVAVVELEGTPNWELAREHGFQPTADCAAAVGKSDVVMLLVPDPVQPRLYREAIGPHLARGAMLMFAHGFNIHYHQIRPPAGVDVTMVAPKGPGHLLRAEYERGGGVPCLMAVEQDATGTAKEKALAYAKGLGGTRAGVLEATFKDETETDLFGEQTVLCGGVSALVRAGFETLVEAGYPPEMAYFECLHELKLIVDLIYRGGLTYMRYSISDTAEYGDFTRGKRIINEQTRAEMRRILQEIQEGIFAREWILENAAGLPVMNALRREARGSLLEVTGRRLRRMMPFVNPKEV